MLSISLSLYQVDYLRLFIAKFQNFGIHLSISYFAYPSQIICYLFYFSIP